MHISITRKRWKHTRNMFSYTICWRATTLLCHRVNTMKTLLHYRVNTMKQEWKRLCEIGRLSNVTSGLSYPEEIQAKVELTRPEWGERSFDWVYTETLVKNANFVAFSLPFSWCFHEGYTVTQQCYRSPKNNIWKWFRMRFQHFSVNETGIRKEKFEFSVENVRLRCV